MTARQAILWAILLTLFRFTRYMYNINAFYMYVTYYMLTRCRSVVFFIFLLLFICDQLYFFLASLLFTNYISLYDLISTYEVVELNAFEATSKTKQGENNGKKYKYTLPTGYRYMGMIIVFVVGKFVPCC